MSENPFLGFAGKTEVEQALVDGICDQWKDFYAETKPFYYGNLGICPPGWEDLVGFSKCIFIHLKTS